MPSVASLLAFAVALLPVTALADSCANPVLVKRLETDFPGWIIVDANDLIDEDREAWAKHHGQACPGLVEGAFRLTNERDYALTAYRRDGQETQQMVLLAIPTENNYRLEVVDKPTKVANLAVVTKVGPGTYTNTDGKTVRVNQDAIFLETIDVATSIYHYDHGCYRADILSD